MQYFVLFWLMVITDADYGQKVNSSSFPLNCHATADSPGVCQVNETCEITCKYLCCNVNSNNVSIYGTGTYLSSSSVCRSALHDLRFSPEGTKDRKIKIRKFHKNGCFLQGSVRYGFSSRNFEKKSCDVFEFISPRISENTSDIVSIHSNYIYEENEDHTQVCVSTQNNSNIKFGIYSKWEKSCRASIKGKETKYEASTRYSKVWSDVKSVGFQCYLDSAPLSIVTSVTLRKDASFYPVTFTIVANKHEDVILAMDEIDIGSGNDTVWMKDDRVIQLRSDDESERTRLLLYNVDESLSGIYSLDYLSSVDEKPGSIQLIVKVCPKNRFGDNCTKTCSSCLNGGICHDITGECLCAPGFNGSLCENACNPGYIGKMCSIKCSGNNSIQNQTCKGLLICLPSPYGCSCSSGFSGLMCDTDCPEHSYGANCLQQHKYVHYKTKSCNKYFDYCDCMNGWHGNTCNKSYPLLSSPPFLINVTENSIALKFSKWSNTSDKGVGIPAFYEVIFKDRKGNDWESGPIISAEDDNETYEVQLQPLKPATNYSVGVLVIDASENKQEMDLELLNVTTKCDDPSAPPQNVEISADDLYISIQWELPPKENWNCWGINTSVYIRESFSNLSKECMKIDSNSCFFYSDPFLNWIIEVCASVNGRNENCAKPKNISAEGTFHSTPIELEIVKRETSLSLAWIPPRFSDKLSHYVIKHVDMDTNATISVPIQTDDAVCDSDRDQYHCYTINNLIPAHAYKVEIVAFYVNFNEGNVIKSFIVSLEKPSVAPSAILGVCLPLVLIFCIIALILFMQRRKRIKSSLKVKFLPYKIENEFAACNEALDEMDIIETESMSEEITNPLNIGELPEFVKQSIQNVKIRKEFMSVPTGQIYPCSMAKLGENKPKNRYGNILPYDHSRVVLDIINGDPFSNYIHASYVHGYNKVNKYIATQGPLSNTVNDFWRMVWNEGSCKILMITNFMENCKCKCEKYWSDDSCTFGDISVSLENSKSYADFIIRTFKISKDESDREVKHFHFTTWPDHGAPSNVTPFLYYLKNTRNYKPGSEAPIIIHCSAGIGRTGATILLDCMLDMAFLEKKVDLVYYLCSMRKQRMNIVENFDQYVFVYQALVESLCFEDTCVKVSDFSKEFERLKTVDIISGTTFLEKQFQALNKLTVELMYKDLQGAYLQENQDKNRSMLILPPDRARPFLSRESSGYINAVYVDSFSMKDAYIATQYPLPNTVHDFWSMIYQQKSKIIVLLQDMEFAKELTPQLWQSEGTEVFEEIEITCQSTTSLNEMTIIHINVSLINEPTKDSLSITIIELKQWPHDTNIPQNSANLLSTISEVQALHNEFPSIITVLCLDGVTACGIFCAILYVCDQIRAEQEVDVFHAIKCTRTNRPHFIKNLAQYEFLLDIISSYINSVPAIKDQIN